MTSTNEKVGGRWRAVPTNNQCSTDTKRIALNHTGGKGNALPAAVFDECDPRSFSSARAVPTSARRAMVGGATVGYWKKDRSAMDGASWRFVVARQRYNELARLARYRLENGLDLGPPVAWAMTLANLSVCLGKAADVTAIAGLCRRLQLPQLDEDVAAAACHNAGTELMKAAHVGALLQVTGAEREDCRLLRIDAWDEASGDRKRRLARDRQRRRRDVTRTIETKKRKRDTRRSAASPALRALRSSCAVRLTARQEPHRFPFPHGENRKAGTTSGRRDLSSTGVADAPAGSPPEHASGININQDHQPAATTQPHVPRPQTSQSPPSQPISWRQT